MSSKKLEPIQLVVGCLSGQFATMQAWQDFRAFVGRQISDADAGGLFCSGSGRQEESLGISDQRDRG